MNPIEKKKLKEENLKKAKKKMLDLEKNKKEIEESKNLESKDSKKLDSKNIILESTKSNDVEQEKHNKIIKLVKTNDGNLKAKVDDDIHLEEESKQEESKQEESKQEESKQEEPKQEEPKQEEPKQEEPKQEEPKQEEPKQEEQKQEEPKQEEPKQEEPKQEEPKQEEFENPEIIDLNPNEEVTIENLPIDDNTKRNMNKKMLIGFAIGAVSMLVGFFLGNLNNGTIATFSKGKLTENEVIKENQSKIDSLASDDLTMKVIEKNYPKQSKDIFDNVNKQLNQLKKQLGGENQFNDFLTMQGKNQESLKKELAYNKLIQLAVYEELKPSEKTLKEMYDNQDNTKYTFIDCGIHKFNKSDLNDILKQNKKGKKIIDFEQKSHNEISVPLKTLQKSGFETDFINKLSKAKVNQFDYISSKDGEYHIFKLEKKEKISFNDMKKDLIIEYISNQLDNQSKMKEVFDKLYKKANVKIVNGDFSSLKNPSKFIIPKF